mgnify:CR=1 FL=1
MKKKALIFGISGQDGIILSDYLLKKKYNVFGYIRNKNKKKYLNNKIKLFLKKKLTEKFILSIIKKTNDSLSSSTIQKLLDSYKVYFYYEKNIIVSIIKTIVLSFNFMKKKLNDY